MSALSICSSQWARLRPSDPGIDVVGSEVKYHKERFRRQYTVGPGLAAEDDDAVTAMVRIVVVIEVPPAAQRPILGTQRRHDAVEPDQCLSGRVVKVFPVERTAVKDALVAAWSVGCHAPVFGELLTVPEHGHAFGCVQGDDVWLRFVEEFAVSVGLADRVSEPLESEPCDESAVGVRLEILERGDREFFSACRVPVARWVADEFRVQLAGKGSLNGGPVSCPAAS